MNARSRPIVACAWLALAACKHDAEVRGTVSQAGKGVPGATVSMECPDGTKHVATTVTGGDFRFDDLGAGVDDACELQVHLQGAWVPTQSISSRCTKRDDRSPLCTEARFAFEVP